MFTDQMLSISTAEIGVINVQFDRYDGTNRANYKWIIEIANMRYEGDDLGVPMLDDKPLNDAKALHALLGFLSAFAEAVEWERRNPGRKSENGHLFPAELRDWAEEITSDGFTMLASSVGDYD